MKKKVIFIIGPSAVGKMAVGEELSQLTGIPLMHNHLTIEPVIKVFGEYKAYVIEQLRNIMIDEIAISDLPGVIMTFVIFFDRKLDIEYIESIKNRFSKYADVEFYYAELECSIDIRIERNKTEKRLLEKPSKRDIKESETRLIHDDKYHRTNSLPGDIEWENYIKVNNENLTPREVAKIIVDKFNL